MPGQAIVTIRDKQWQVAVANTPWELEQGLAGVLEIPPGTGMFFDTGWEQYITVTTVPMLFPLDIAFFSEMMVVTEVYRNVEPGYLVHSTLPARYFLEVNAGELEGIESGDRASVMLLPLEEIPVAPDWISPMVGLFGFMVMGTFMVSIVRDFTKKTLEEPAEKAVLYGPRGERLLPQTSTLPLDVSDILVTEPSWIPEKFGLPKGKAMARTVEQSKRLVDLALKANWGAEQVALTEHHPAWKVVYAFESLMNDEEFAEYQRRKQHFLPQTQSALTRKWYDRGVEVGKTDGWMTVEDTLAETLEQHPEIKELHDLVWTDIDLWMETDHFNILYGSKMWEDARGAADLYSDLESEFWEGYLAGRKAIGVDIYTKASELLKSPQLLPQAVRKREIVYTVNLEAPKHVEEIVLEDAKAVLKRYGKPVVTFRPTDTQKRKIQQGKGHIHIFADQIEETIRPWRVREALYWPQTGSITPEAALPVFMEMAGWYVKHRRPMTVKELRPIATRHFATEEELREFYEYLKSPQGQKEFRRELRDAMRRHGILIPPEQEWVPLTVDTLTGTAIIPSTKGKRPTRYDVSVDSWVERDRTGIWVTDKRTGKTIAEWWDEDAREMFEQGFFKPGEIRHQEITGRAFEESVLDYAESVGLLAGSGKYLAQTVRDAYYWTAINKDTGEITESNAPYTSSGRALRGGKAFVSRHWRGEALVEVWRQPHRYSERLKIQPVASETLSLIRQKAPAIIPKHPRPTRLKDELEFLPDSPEFLAYTIEDIGYREKIDSAFLSAIARAKGG